MVLGESQRADFIQFPLPAAPMSHQLPPYGCWGSYPFFLRRAQTSPSIVRNSVAVGQEVQVPSQWLCWCPSQSVHKGMQPGELGEGIDKAPVSL